MENDFTLILRLPRIEILEINSRQFIFEYLINYKPKLTIAYFGKEIDCSSEFIFKEDDDLREKSSYISFYFCATEYPNINNSENDIVRFIIDEFYKNGTTVVKIFDKKDADIFVKHHSTICWNLPK